MPHCSDCGDTITEQVVQRGNAQLCAHCSACPAGSDCAEEVCIGRTSK